MICHVPADVCSLKEGGPDLDRVCGLNEFTLYPAAYIKNLLAEFFEIDLKKVEEERRKMLDHLVEANHAKTE